MSVANDNRPPDGLIAFGGLLLVLAILVIVCAGIYQFCVKPVQEHFLISDREFMVEMTSQRVY